MDKERKVHNKKIVRWILLVILLAAVFILCRVLYSFGIIQLPGKSVTQPEPVPEDYYGEAEKPGKVVKLDYDAAGIEEESNKVTKTAYVYLPYGYDENDPQTRYNIFYLMHGGGGSASGYLGGENGNMELKRILDHMIENGDMEPMIVVTSTYYRNDSDDSDGELTKKFPVELINDLMPAVEGTYHTYAETTDKDGLRVAREHRIFGGFSMGSVTTWYTFADCLDYFKFYLPMSGDCWLHGMLGNFDLFHQMTAADLNKAAQESGYARTDYYIYAATGTDDIAYNVLSEQVRSMKRYEDSFAFDSDFAKGNFYFDVAEGYEHDYPAMMVYIYNGLRKFPI